MERHLRVSFLHRASVVFGQSRHVPMERFATFSYVLLKNVKQENI